MTDAELPTHKRSLSGHSSSSAYSDTGSESATKRVTTPSKGGADRRRLAIVQLDSDRTNASIRTRRGYKNDLAGLALIAPPDAASNTYTHLTPPSTAPLTADMMSRALKKPVPDKSHQRSASDITQTLSSHPAIDASKISRTWQSRNKFKANDDNEGDTRAATPQPNSSQSVTSHAAGQQIPATGSPYTQVTAEFGSPISTPDIGDPKDVHIPVAAPIVINLDNVAQPTPRAESPASSTACGHGPARMITRTTIDEHNTSGLVTPRPSRVQPSRSDADSEIGKQCQTRGSGAAFRSAKMDNDLSMGQSNVFTHRREAATATKEPHNLTFSLDPHAFQKPLPNPESNDFTLEELNLNQPDDIVELICPQYRILPPTPAAKPSVSETTQKTKDAPPPKLDHTKFDQWVKENPQYLSRDIRRGVSLEEPRRYGLDPPRSPLPVDVEPPEPPAKSLRQSLTAKVKRFSSISRATSLSSKSAASRSSQETRRSSRTPSPLPSYRTRSPPLISNKIISMNPAALFCHEISGQTTSLQRCYIYANKINELSMYDCGLSNWIVQMKDQSLVPQRQRGPSSRLFVPQPRHTSRSSVISEATFPRRLDATTATDLSPGQFDDLSSPGLPQLPYPSLALRSLPARSNTSSSSITPPTSLRSLTPSFSTSGFFAALGRKASLSKKDRTTAIISTRISAPGVAPSGARLPPTKTSQSITPRPIQITSPPTIPGGPRARGPPSRSKRSQTYFPVSSLPSAAASGRDDTSPLNDTSPLTLHGDVIDIKPDPEFTQQVDKLAALIPQADWNILAGYLRRAGSDMLAIGQYLEDERMGVVRSC